MAVKAQEARPVGIPSVWAHDANDDALAIELTSALRLAVGNISGWTISNLDSPLAELMRACDGEVESASESCIVRMASARDPMVAHGLVILAALMREGGSATNITLHLTLEDAVTGQSPGSIRVPVERIVSPVERNRLATEWLGRLALLTAPAPDAREGPALISPPQHIAVLGFEALSVFEGDDTFAREFTLTVRQALIERGYVVDERMPGQGQMAIVTNCEMPDATCASRMAETLDGVGFLVGGEVTHVAEDPASDLSITLNYYTFDPPVRRRVSGTIVSHPNQTDMVVLARQMVEGMTNGYVEGTSAPMPVAAATSDGFNLGYVTWPLLGLAVASLAMEVVSWLMIDGIQNDADYIAFRSSYGSGTGDVCGQAPTGSALDTRGHSLCSNASNWESVELAFGIIGGAALIGGLTTLILDLTGDEPRDSSVSFRPQLGPTTARLDVSIAF